MDNIKEMMAKLTSEQKEDVREGRLCPKCLAGKSHIKFMGCAPDGMYSNNQYDCKECKFGWEGY